MPASFLYVSDLDGTLLNEEGFLSDQSRRQLEELLADGVLFTVASARSLISIREKLGDLSLTLPVVECNGAYFTDYHSGEKFSTQGLSSEIVRKIHVELLENDSVHFVSTYDGVEDHVYYGEERNGGMEYYLREREEYQDLRLRMTTDWKEIFDETVVCFTAVGFEGPLRDLKQVLSSRYGEELSMHLWEDSYAKGWCWLMIHHQEACKGKAIQRLMEREGLSQYQLTVFGDQVNDLGMMAVADRRIAVSNACPEIRNTADLLIESNQMNAVTRFIYEDVSGKGAASYI